MHGSLTDSCYALARTHRSVPVESIINDIAQMGFERSKIVSVIADMQKEGKAIDLNVVISRCLGS